MSLRAVEHTFTGATTAISSYDSTKTNLGTLMIQKSGANPEDNFVGPLPTAVARPMEESTAVAMLHPSVITFSSTIDWVFLVENVSGLTAARRIFLYEYNKSLATYNWKGFITATLPNATGQSQMGLSALKYLHTTGTVAVAAPVSVYATGTVSLSLTGLITGSGTTFAITHVGKMIGFGSTNVAQINCWYPIIAFGTTTAIYTIGGTSLIAVGTSYVIASCTLTGTSTLFTTDLVAAGTATTGAFGGLGPRIGFGSTDPTQITKWYHIGSIASDTSLNLNTSPGVIAAGTSYVIEELRFAIIGSNTTATNGGLYLLKGAGYHDFTTAGVTFPAIASAVKNERGVYWLCDAGAGAVTNTAPIGIAVASEVDKQTQYAYVLNGSGTSVKIYKYNLRANDTVASGKMQLAGANIVITGTQVLTYTISGANVNNICIATASHGPGSGASFLYFSTVGGLYCSAVASITAGNTPFAVVADFRAEIPPGGVSTFAVTGTMAGVGYISSIDRFVFTAGSGAAVRSYVSRYPSTAGTPFDHIFGLDDKQQDQSISLNNTPHFNTTSQSIDFGIQNGIVHILKQGNTALLNQIYALPFGAHWTYASTASQRVITPSITTTGCVKFDQVLVYKDKYIGTGELGLPPETFRVYYRTANIGADATSSWVLLGYDGDLSAVTAANAIQFMFEFFTISALNIPARIMKVAVTYEDGSTDSHYQLSTSLSSIANERFVWRFTNAFGGTVPTLKIELFNAATDVSIFTDTTVGPANGAWTKSIDGGSNWIAYNDSDKTNEITYIRYIPTSPLGSISVRALLTQN